METEKLLYELKNNKVPWLGLDLDRMSKYDLLLTYFKCRKLFPDAKIEVKISGSGKGFHIIVHETMSVLENILWRTRLGDDARRMMFSLAKFAHNPELPFFDLMFSEKFGKSTKQVDVEGILEHHKEDTDYIWANWGSEEALHRLRDLSEKAEIAIERYWTCSFKIPAEKKDAIVEKMKNISEKDETFKWRVFPNFLGHGYILIIYSPDMDTSHKRGVWIKNKIVEMKGYKYWVRRI